MSEFEWVAVAIVSVVSAARITRLVTVDDLPPVAWVRKKYAQWTGDSDWGLLLFCGYCFGVWAGFGVVLWGWLVDFDTAWWVINGGLSVAYLAAILMAHDGDD